MTNQTPLRREVQETIDALQKAVDELREEHAVLTEQADWERAELISQAREAVKRARANGNAWQIWQRILDEFSVGSPDERGTEFDVLRKFATVMDRAGETIRPYISCSVDYHPKTLEEATAVVDALDVKWRDGYGTSFRGFVAGVGGRGYSYSPAVGVSLFFDAAWKSELRQYIVDKNHEASEEKGQLQEVAS